MRIPTLRGLLILTDVREKFYIKSMRILLKPVGRHRSFRPAVALPRIDNRCIEDVRCTIFGAGWLPDRTVFQSPDSW